MRKHSLAGYSHERAHTGSCCQHYLGGRQLYANFFRSYITTVGSVRPLPVFNAGTEVKDVTAGLNATYLLDRHWFLMTNAGVKLLLGDAEKSSITNASSSLVFGTIVGYHFQNFRERKSHFGIQPVHSTQAPRQVFKELL